MNKRTKPPINTDVTHLQWLYDRLIHVYGENENYDYMLKFKEIINKLVKNGKVL